MGYGDGMRTRESRGAALVVASIGSAFVGVPATLLPLDCPAYLVLITQACVVGAVFAYLWPAIRENRPHYPHRRDKPDAANMNRARKTQRNLLAKPDLRKKKNLGP